MKAYTVYHCDSLRQVREAVGEVVERRNKDRGDNARALLKLAQKVYPTPKNYRLVLTPK